MSKLNSSNLSNQILRYSKQTNRKLADSSRKLASGSRIVKASDDAAGLSIATNLNAEIRSKKQAQRNANDAFSVIQIMDGSLSEMQNMVIRIRELSIGAASDSYSDNERQMMNLEATGLLEELGRVASTTKYMDRDLFNGEEYKLDFHIDSGSGEENRISMDLSNQAQTPHALGLEGLQIDTKLRAQLSLARLDYAQNAITQSRTEIGAYFSRFESVVNKLGNDIVNGESTKSRITDLDYANETANSVKNKILINAQTSLLSQSNENKKAYLKLIKG